MSAISETISEYMKNYLGGRARFTTTRDIGINIGDGPRKMVMGSSSDESTNEAAPVYKKDYESMFSPKDWESIVTKAEAWGKDPKAIAAIITLESSGKTTAKNAHTNARGLFQIMPSTARGLGIEPESIEDMDFDEQLDLGEKYFKSYGKKWEDAKSAQDMYSLVFYPAMVGKDDDYVLGSQSGASREAKIAEQNKIFDSDKDGKVTKGEVNAWGEEHFRRGGILYKK